MNEVDLLKTAHGFHQAGYAVLLFDFRSHGESQAGLCAGGLSEINFSVHLNSHICGILCHIIAPTCWKGSRTALPLRVAPHC
jgi:alpha-beta hydrolase superfamily lysophospholipase